MMLWVNIIVGVEGGRGVGIGAPENKRASTNKGALASSILCLYFNIKMRGISN